MHYASHGARNAARKGYSALIHHGGHNGPGGSASSNQLPCQVRAYSQTPSTSFNVALQSIAPRNPPLKLFSASKNFLQRFFTYLTTPGLRVPTHLSQAYGMGARSLHHPLRSYSIQSGLSLPAKHALRNNALRMQANAFLPRAPGPVPARCGGVAQVGLGAARNFSSARPIFQNLVQNVPVAGRALYEIDWDVEMRKEQEHMRLRVRKSSKRVLKTKEMIKSTNKVPHQRDSTYEKENVSVEDANPSEDIEHYFPAPHVAPVTTYLLIPLAPTPTSRHPLPLNPEISRRDPTLLPPLSELGSLHASHSTHALRLNTLFTRLDQTNVWARGNVHCLAYSQGDAYRKPKNDDSQEGVCTILKIEFVGWTKAEVRGVIGESGSGWCALEEVRQDEVPSEEVSDLDSLYSESQSSSSPSFDSGLGLDDAPFDPAQSLVLPSLDLSPSPSRQEGPESFLTSIPSEMEREPWADDYPYSPSSGFSSYSDLSEFVIDPPSSNGWVGIGHEFGPGATLGRSNVSLDGEEIQPMEEFY